jgi:hypothetical protein
MSAQRTEGSIRNKPKLSFLATLLRYADEGEQDCYSYWERIIGASLPTRVKACFNALKTSQFTFNPKVLGYECSISWEGYADRVFGFLGSTVSPFSEAW